MFKKQFFGYLKSMRNQSPPQTSQIYSQIISSQQISPDDYKFPSKLEVVPNNNSFRKDDYISLVSLRMKDLYSSNGRVVIINATAKTIITTIKIDYEIESYEDIMAEFVLQQQGKSDCIQIIPVLDENKKFTRFNFSNNSKAIPLIINAYGNLQNVLGIHQLITLNPGYYIQGSDDNSLRIEYIKIVCRQVNASLQSIVTAMTKSADGGLLQRKYSEFEEGTLIVINKSSKFCYTNKNLDVHLMLGTNPPFIFEILDQDNRPVNLSYLVMEIQFYQKSAINFSDEGFLPSQIKGHTKNQLYVHLKQEQITINLPVTCNKVSLSDVNGSIKDILFTQRSSIIRLIRFNVEEKEDQLTTIKSCQDLLDYTNIDNDPTIKYDQLKAFTATTTPFEYKICLYDEEDFADYRNKFIDYDFMEILGQWLTKQTGNKMNIQINHDKSNNKLIIQYSVQYKYPADKDSKLKYIAQGYFFTVVFQDGSIMNRVFNLEKCGFGNIYQKPQIHENVDFTGVYYDSSVYIASVQLSQMFCYSTMFYIYVNELGYDQLLGVVIGNNLVLEPLNKSVFCWKELKTTSKQLTFKIVSYIEDEFNNLVQVENKYIPDLYMRLLIK
ncbi:Hypothetical_protein [Hexamita inflata]|uniref:Hypothetical_protein n=1 Tax=Hexamita inflata TaxID=28002 RepID=A0AA86Q4Z8_9EUKA|nr:Hypothetical protein HINF_LOCUS40070 [Hexamita inflata]